MQTKPIVIGEHTLAILNPARPLQAEILRAVVHRGAPWRDHLTTIIPLAPDEYRDATPADFDTYRVSSKGFFPATA